MLYACSLLNPEIGYNELQGRMCLDFIKQIAFQNSDAVLD